MKRNRNSIYWRFPSFSRATIVDMSRMIFRSLISDECLLTHRMHDDKWGIFCLKLIFLRWKCEEIKNQRWREREREKRECACIWFRRCPQKVASSSTGYTHLYAWVKSLHLTILITRRMYVRAWIEEKEECRRKVVFLSQLWSLK